MTILMGRTHARVGPAPYQAKPSQDSVFVKQMGSCGASCLKGRWAQELDSSWASPQTQGCNRSRLPAPILAVGCWSWRQPLSPAAGSVTSHWKLKVALVGISPLQKGHTSGLQPPWQGLVTIHQTHQRSAPKQRVCVHSRRPWEDP